jgi:hypothetical protein
VRIGGLAALGVALIARLITANGNDALAGLNTLPFAPFSRLPRIG